MTEHTKEPWFTDGECIWRRHPAELYENGGGVAGDKPLAIVNKGWYGEGLEGFPVETNARRIVACVNALQGVSTEALVEAVNLGITDVSSGNLFSSRLALQRQRDNLLEALKDAKYLIKGREHTGFIDDLIAEIKATK